MPFIQKIIRYFRFFRGVCEYCGGDLVSVEGWKKYVCEKCGKTD